MSEVKKQTSGRDLAVDFNLLNCQIFLDKILPDQLKSGSWQITLELVGFAFRFGKVKKGMDDLLELQESWNKLSSDKSSDMSTGDLYEFFCGEDFASDGLDHGPPRTRYTATELVVSMLQELLDADRFWRTPTRVQALASAKRFLGLTDEK